MPLENFATSDHDPLFGIANVEKSINYTPTKQNSSTDDMSVLANAAKNINISPANHGLSTYGVFLIENAVQNISLVSADKSPITDDMFLSDAENVNVTSVDQVPNTVENATQNINLTSADLSLSTENASMTESSKKIVDFSSANQGASADNEKNAAQNVNLTSADQVASKDNKPDAEYIAQNVQLTSADQDASADNEKNAALNVNLTSADHDASADNEKNAALNVNLTSADQGASADNEKNAALNVNLTSADQGASADNEKNAAQNVNLTPADHDASADNKKNAALNVNLTSADQGASADDEKNAAHNVNLTSADQGASADNEKNAAQNVNLTSADQGLSANNEDNAAQNVNLTSATQGANTDNEKNAVLNVNLTSADHGASADNEKNAAQNVNLTLADQVASADNEKNAAQNVNNFISEDLLVYLSLHSFSILDRLGGNVSVESSMAAPFAYNNNEKTTFIKELPIRWPETLDIDTNSFNENGVGEGSTPSLQTFGHSNMDSLEDTISLQLSSGSIPPLDTSILPLNSSILLSNSSHTLPQDISILPSESSTLLSLDRLENSNSGLQPLVNSTLSPLENNTVILVEDDNTLSSMVSSTLPPLDNLEEPMEEKRMAEDVTENGRPEETLSTTFTADTKTDPETSVTTSVPTERTTTKRALNETPMDFNNSSNIKTFTIKPQVILIDPVQIFGSSLESKSPSADAILPLPGYNITGGTQSFVSHSTEIPRQATSQAQSFASFTATGVNLTTTIRPFDLDEGVTALTTSAKGDISDSTTTEATIHEQSASISASNGSSESGGLIETERSAEDHLSTGNKSLKLDETVQKTCVADCEVEVVTPANEESLSLKADRLDESSPASIVFPATEVKGQARPAAQGTTSRDRASASIPGGGLPPGWSRPLSDLFWRLEAAEGENLSSRLTSGRPTLSYSDLSLRSPAGEVRRPERTFLFADIGGQRLPYYDLRPPDERLMRSQSDRLYLE
jgi:hypothetical protein